MRAFSVCTSYRIKHALAVLLILAFLVWPPVHAGLARSMWINPWKLSGWGMYATLHSIFDADLIARDREGDILYTREQLPPALKQEFMVFANRRKTAGKLIRGKAFAEALFEYSLAVTRIEIHTHLRRMDPDNKYLRALDEVLIHERD